jgi:hypothetical protein
MLPAAGGRSPEPAAPAQGRQLPAAHRIIAQLLAEVLFLHPVDSASSTKRCRRFPVDWSQALSQAEFQSQAEALCVDTLPAIQGSKSPNAQVLRDGNVQGVCAAKPLLKIIHQYRR